MFNFKFNDVTKTGIEKSDFTSQVTELTTSIFASPVGFTKYGTFFGYMHINTMVKAAMTAGATNNIGTLPSEYLPSANLHFSEGRSKGMFEITTNGVVNFLPNVNISNGEAVSVDFIYPLLTFGGGGVKAGLKDCFATLRRCWHELPNQKQWIDQNSGGIGRYQGNKVRNREGSGHLGTRGKNSVFNECCFNRQHFNQFVREYKPRKNPFAENRFWRSANSNQRLDIIFAGGAA